MFYDVVDGHFVAEIDGVKYDWSGEVKDDETPHIYVEWEKFDDYDPLVKERVVEGCIM